MRLMLIFLALVTFSFALASTIALFVATTETGMPVLAPQPSGSLQGYVTITVLPPPDEESLLVLDEYASIP